MGNVSAHLDYPLKDSLCVAWHILFLFLVVNAFIKQGIIFRCIEKIRIPFSNTIYEAKRSKKRWAYSSLPVHDKDKYLIQYQTLIYQRLLKIVPQDIAFIIIGYYIPNNFIYSKEKNETNPVTNNPDQSEKQNTPQTKTETQPETDTMDTQSTTPTIQMSIKMKKKMRKKKPIERKQQTNDSSSTSKTSNTFSFSAPFDMNNPFTDATTFENWCNGNNQEQDIDRKEEIDEWKLKNKGRRRRRGGNQNIPQYGEQYLKTVSLIMDRAYLGKHNEEYQDIAMNKKIETAMEGDHKWRLMESGYVLFKNIMMLITSIIFIMAFAKWSVTEENSYLRFIGFILLFHYHPSITSVNMMRWLDLDVKENGYGAMPCASPCIIPLLLWMTRNEKEQNIAKRLYFDNALKWFTFFNHWTGTYGIWLISLPFVFGGGFWFTHIIWLVYLALGVVICIFGAIFYYTCGKILEGSCDFDDDIGSGVMWIVAFFYHTTGIMYIIGLVFHDRSGPAFVEISTGTYCDGGVMSLDMSDGRVLWIVLSWIL